MPAPMKDFKDYWVTVDGFTFPRAYLGTTEEGMKDLLRKYEENPLRFHSQKDLIKWVKYELNKQKVIDFLTQE